MVAVDGALPRVAMRVVGAVFTKRAFHAQSSRSPFTCASNGVVLYFGGVNCNGFANEGQDFVWRSVQAYRFYVSSSYNVSRVLSYGRDAAKQDASHEAKVVLRGLRPILDCPVGVQYLGLALAVTSRVACSRVVHRGVGGVKQFLYHYDLNRHGP